MTFETFRYVFFPFRPAVLCALLFLTACNPNHGSPRVEDEVRQAFDNLTQASRTLNHDRFLAHFEPEGFSIVINGETRFDFDEFSEFYLTQSTQIERIDTLNFDLVHITVLNPNSAILLNHYTQTLQLKSGEMIEASGSGTQIWVRRGDNWKIIHVGSHSEN